MFDRYKGKTSSISPYFAAILFIYAFYLYILTPVIDWARAKGWL